VAEFESNGAGLELNTHLAPQVIALMTDSYLFDAGWLFFAVWSAVVVVINLAAFRGDLFPSRALPRSLPPVPGADPARSREPGSIKSLQNI